MRIRTKAQFSIPMFKQASPNPPTWTHWSYPPFQRYKKIRNEQKIKREILNHTLRTIEITPALIADAFTLLAFSMSRAIIRACCKAISHKKQRKKEGRKYIRCSLVTQEAKLETVVLKHPKSRLCTATQGASIYMQAFVVSPLVVIFLIDKQVSQNNILLVNKR